MNAVTVKLYANYGMLSHEKEIVFGTAPAEITDEIMVTLPEGWTTAKNKYDDILYISPWGETYFLDDILYGKNSNLYMELIKPSGEIYSKKLTFEIV